eukprot:TRINITY_DN711_c0_g1_i6.p1 TRINITY_DN711_c0_g1~~TRINITY_DN711_c0_g1_i6.p1  ORF type:complete len:227 (+),score=54.50 TRINITY_DN711_c0_g1_i6:77-757(+)
MQAPPEVLPPNNTLYVNNLNEKVTKDELTRSLFHVFGQFGRIADVLASKTLKMRGQAFIIFDDVAAATRALREMQGFNFYGKPMRVSYARSKSDVISKRDGSFIPRPKRKPDRKEEKEPAAKVSKKRDHQAPQTSMFSGRTSIYEEDVPPNSVLFIQNLPRETNEQMLLALFQQYDGFKEVRLIEEKPGIAFVEFYTDFQATRAMEVSQGFRITPNNAMHISYAKK